MEPILYLVHRIPYPPNKGDKIRSYHLLRYLAANYRVHLGTFVDDGDDHRYVGELDALTTERHVVALNPATARLRSLSGLLRGEALTLPYYRHEDMQRWVEETVRANNIRKAVVFSSAMAQYVVGLPELQTVADFCDVDSAKWTEYAARRAWPASWVYRREGERLLAFERAAASRSSACTFATPAEAELFARLAPECAPYLHAVGNGVDTGFFAPDPAFENPYRQDEAAVVFTGAMDYWPNVDAVAWFARDILASVVRRCGQVRFYIVGMNPTPEVRALANDPRVVVTGKVADVRPYLQHAQAVVVPLRVARGVQNKLLEAMAMARAVVATSACVLQLSDRVRSSVSIADDASGFADAVAAVLAPDAKAEERGRRGRAAVVADYSWTRNLTRFGELLGEARRVPAQETVYSSIAAVRARLGSGVST